MGEVWQFLLDMLLTPDKSFMIQWTGNEYEFTILQPDDIAAMWGERKRKPRMNYDKLSHDLRYYYGKGILNKVSERKLTFKFTCNVLKIKLELGAGILMQFKHYEQLYGTVKNITVHLVTTHNSTYYSAVK